MGRCNCGKSNCNSSHYDTFRFKIFNEGTKNTRKKVPTKIKKSKGSMTDIATKLGIKIKESFLNEDALLEDKADKQRFIDKFGKDNFDTFWNNRQRLKNKGINADITWHAKHTSVSDMLKILDSISDEKIASERDYEGNPLPEPTNNYEVVFKNDEYTVYHPMDYVSSIYCAKGGRWCTAGGYMIPDGQVKVSQAKQYFNQYTNRGVSLYYFIRNNGERYALATYANSDAYEVYNKADENIGNISSIPNIEDIEIEGLDITEMIEMGSRIECDNCGDSVSEGDVYYGPNNEVYCSSCWSELCGWCSHCDEVFWVEELVFPPDRDPLCPHCYGEFYVECDFCHSAKDKDYVYPANTWDVICQDCVDSGEYVWCDECDEIVHHSDVIIWDDEYQYCKDCFDAMFQPCDGCGAITPWDDLTRDTTGRKFCTGCAPDVFGESLTTSTMRFKVRREL